MGAVGVLEGGPPPTRLPSGAYYALTVLTALNVINLWHRYLMVSSRHPCRHRLYVGCASCFVPQLRLPQQANDGGKPKSNH